MSEPDKCQPLVWTWSTNEETWTNEMHATREDAIADAINCVGGSDSLPFWTGRSVPIDVNDLALDIVEALESHITDDGVHLYLDANFGEVSEDKWKVCDEDVNELKCEIFPIVKAWLERNKLVPELYGLEEIEEHTVGAEKADAEDGDA